MAPRPSFRLVCSATYPGRWRMKRPCRAGPRRLGRLRGSAAGQRGGSAARPAQRAVERRIEHLVEGVGEHELELLPRLVREVGEIGLVLAGKDHAVYTRALRRQDLLAHAADLQHLTRERD